VFGFESKATAQRFLQDLLRITSLLTKRCQSS